MSWWAWEGNDSGCDCCCLLCAQQGTLMTSSLMPTCQNLWPFCILFSYPPPPHTHTNTHITKNVTILLPTKVCIIAHKMEKSDLEDIRLLIPLYFQTAHKRNPTSYSHRLSCSSWLPSASAGMFSTSGNSFRQAPAPGSLNNTGTYFPRSPKVSKQVNFTIG